MKKVITLIITSVFVLNLLITTNVQAAMSDWATSEVTSSTSKNLVPEVLQSDYTTNIKRYEYVLLALEVLEQTNREVKIVRMYPFTDIYGHDYETEIVRAYNAGLINGDGKGHFKPDDEITRQEVAVLVCNLVKMLNGDTVIDEGNVYADGHQIAAWAKASVDYSYDHGILKGVGTGAESLSMMDPLGSATREQSIVLLYRLAKNESLLKDIDLGEGGYTEFAHESNEALARHLLNLNTDTNFKVNEIDQNNFEVIYKNTDVLNLSQSSSEVEVIVKTDQPMDEILKAELLDIVSYYCDADDIEVMIFRSDNGFAAEGDTYVSEVSSQLGYEFLIKKDDTLGKYTYTINIDNRIYGGI